MIETRLNLHFATERCEIKEILSFLQRNVSFKDHLRAEFFWGVGILLIVT